MWLKIVRDLLFHGTMDGAASERVSKRTRILCLLLTSVLLLLVIACLFLAAFLSEGQSLLRRVGFLFLGLGAFFRYLEIQKSVGRKERRNRDATGH